MQDNKRWTRDQKIKVAQICAYVFIGLVGIGVGVIIKLAPANNKTVLLSVRPTAFIPYIPDKPQAPGQRKADIVAQLKLFEKSLANVIHVKFDIDDGADRRVNSDKWAKEIGETPLTMSMSDPAESVLVSWRPDIPVEIEKIARNRKKPFQLWLTVTWEDINKKEHKLESYSKLRYDEKLKLFYWDERTNRLVY